MKKIFVVAIATSLVLANGASVAFADSGSDSDDSGSSTTVVERSGNPRVKAAQEAARKVAQKAVRKAQEDAIAKYRHDQITFRVELTKYLASRRTIEMTFRTAKVNATRTFESARKSTTARNARQIAGRNFKVAINTAQRIYRDSMDALGSPPVNPVKP